MRTITEAHERAKKMVEAGMSVNEACKTAGLAPCAVYSSDWYKALRASGKYGNRRTSNVSRGTRQARELIEGGMSVVQACSLAGIHSATIYKSKWWKER